MKENNSARVGLSISDRVVAEHHKTHWYGRSRGVNLGGEGGRLHYTLISERDVIRLHRIGVVAVVRVVGSIIVE